MTKLTLDFVDEPNLYDVFKDWIALLGTEPKEFDFEIEDTTYTGCTHGDMELVEGPGTLTFTTTIFFKGTK